MGLRYRPVSREQLDAVELCLPSLAHRHETRRQRSVRHDAQYVDRQTADFEAGVESRFLDELTDQRGDRSARHGVGEPRIARETRRHESLSVGDEIMRRSEEHTTELPSLRRS